MRLTTLSARGLRRDEVPIGRADAVQHGARRAVSDPAAIDLDDRGLGAEGARGEGLVRPVGVDQGEVALVDGYFIAAN